ncbi:hypothetical protein PENOC_041950 [Penicillium occitanis (nom. inval.)]|nr:hypothetical protein PENOC_041950 [Penicillium occitanis (nom. inval.)]
MGTNSIPTEAAPAYEDLFAGHERPGNTSSGYTSIPQTDLLHPEEIDNRNNDEIDIEQQQQPDDVHLHQHQHIDNAEGVDGEGQGHIHCTACDRLLERKEQRMNQRHCCTMVAVTFMVAFLCLMILGLGIVVVKKD